MVDYSGRMLAIGGGAILVGLLIGVLIWTGMARETGSAEAPFQLQGTHGKMVDQTVFKGRPTLVYFGYTHCPELCPTTLADMASWLETLGDEGAQLQALFFTIDPERDTVARMAQYVSHFSDRIVGVTGDPSELRKLTSAWLVTADVNPSETSYSVRHTTSVLLVGANGRVAGMIPYGMDRDAAVARIRDFLLSRNVDVS